MEMWETIFIEIIELADFFLLSTHSSLFSDILIFHTGRLAFSFAEENKREQYGLKQCDEHKMHEWNDTIEFQ